VSLGAVWASAAVPPNRAKIRRAALPTAWEKAVKARTDFEALPAGTHTRASYTKVMDGFRAIYHDAPRDEHAPDAVYAVAELLAEQGRELGDTLSLRNAVGQYEFLRWQYPASSLRVPALLAEGHIEGDELKDDELARDKYRGVVKESPKSKAAVEAKAALKTLGKGAGTVGAAPVVVQVPTPAAASVAVPVAAGIQAVPATTTVATVPAVPDSGPVAATTEVTGIRHWSTATYTRVAIDLGDRVTYRAARGSDPDRISFDLHGAKLGAKLAGKTFNVTDDGFLKKISASQASPGVARVVLDVSDVTEYTAFLLPNPYRLIVDIHGASVRGGSKVTVAAAQMTEVPVALADAARANAAANLSGLPAMAATKLEGAQPSLEEAQPTLKEAQPAAPAPRVAAVVAPAAATPVPVASDATLPVAPKRRKKGAKDAEAAQAAAPAKAADPTADGETSLVRALGLKVNRIVIDAGHGGHDSGTIGADGIEEKDVVLDVALRVGKLLHDRLGAEIVYTRSDDTFIPLETRTAIANKAQADLFLSIHANSSQDDSARGVEVYYLNFTSDPAALEVAARENAVSGESVHQLSDLVKKIALKNKISESREFAGDVEASLYGGLAKGNDGLKNRGVKKAPFVVLIGANMPSILAEISFVTNPKDAAQLRRPEYRERVAESLFNGVARYENGLGGAKPVQPVTRASIQ
jgi:N-acetylmuramoyl-L-alanine amidase